METGGCRAECGEMRPGRTDVVPVPVPVPMPLAMSVTLLLSLSMARGDRRRQRYRGGADSRRGSVGGGDTFGAGLGGLVFELVGDLKALKGRGVIGEHLLEVGTVESEELWRCCVSVEESLKR